MFEKDLKYKLAEPKPEDFVTTPLNFAIAKTKARAVDGTLLINISWYDTKLLIQRLDSNYFLPTSSQWHRAREYLQENYPESVKNYLIKYEWVDSLLAFPNEEGNYSPRLRISGIKKGKAPLLIEQSKIERFGNNYILTEGKVTEVPELPLKSDYIQGWNEDLGLPTEVGKDLNKDFEKSYFYVNTDYGFHEGLRAIIRVGQFGILAHSDPSTSGFAIGFRLGRYSKT